MIKKIFTILGKINIRSIILNFYLFPLKLAIKLPLLVSRRTCIKSLKRGTVHLNCKPSFGMIQIGYSTVSIIDYKYERAILDIAKEGSLTFNGKAFIGCGTKISVHGNLIFGNNVKLNGNTKILCLESVEFGDDCLVSWDCQFMDADFHMIYENGVHINPYKAIKVGKNVLIFSKATITKGGGYTKWLYSSIG